MAQYSKINGLNKKKHMILTTDTQNAFDKIYHPLMIRTFSKLEKDLLQPNNMHQTKPISLNAD